MYKILIKEHKRKLTLVFTGVLLLTFVVLNMIVSKYGDFVPEYIANDLVYFEVSENQKSELLEYLDSNNLKYEKTISLLSKDITPYIGGLNNKILINDLTYINETSKDLPAVNQNLLMNQIDTLKTMWAFNLNSSLLIKENTYIKNNIYNIKQVIGSWPQKENEVLISENIAMSLLKEKEVTKYEDLIGQQVTLSNSNSCKENCFTRDYTVSGVYKRENLDVGNNEYYIINPTDEIKDKILGDSNCGYVVKVNKIKQIKELENNFNFITFISSKDNDVNVEKALKMSVVIISNLLLVSLLFSDFKKDYLKLRFLGVNKIKSILSLGYFILIFNLILLILILII